MESASKKNDGRDRLSDLPDELLVRILSILPTLDAVRTVLLRRFGDLWTMVDSLSFDDYYTFVAKLPKIEESHHGETFASFSRFVGNTLDLHKRITIDKFELSVHEPIGLQELRLTTPSIEKLDLLVGDNGPSLLDFPNLKILHIGLSAPLKVVRVSSVREVVFRSFCIDDNPCQALLRLAECLLRSAVNLERMVFVPKKDRLAAVDKLEFMKQLLRFSRASAIARIVFE